MPESKPSKEVVHVNGQPLKVILQKTATRFNWEVHVSGANVAEILPIIREANTKLMREYKGGG